MATASTITEPLHRSSGGTYARIIADSVNEAGDRLTTMEVRFHRFVLAEFNTHRVFSRNSASSRAIPLHKQVQRVTTDPAEPVVWASEQKGMQGGDEIAEPSEAARLWRMAADDAVESALALRDLDVHKSIVNRLLEPFMMHTVVVTATAWENFFGLRCNPLAQPEIKVAADLMYEVYQASEPRPLKAGDWHLPYITEEDYAPAHAIMTRPWGEFSEEHPEGDQVGYPSPIDVLVRVSAARCARVSYLTQDGKRDLDEDLVLYERLTSATPMHASPLEHVARPYVYNKRVVRIPGSMFTLELPEYGNLLGWHQHRFDVEASRAYQAFS